MPLFGMSATYRHTWRIHADKTLGTYAPPAGFSFLVGTAEESVG
jgi:hypothetical protein